MHPLIHFWIDPVADSQPDRPRGDVWEVIATVRDNNGSIPFSAQYLQVPAGLVEAAVGLLRRIPRRDRYRDRKQ